MCSWLAFSCDTVSIVLEWTMVCSIQFEMVFKIGTETLYTIDQVRDGQRDAGLKMPSNSLNSIHV